MRVGHRGGGGRGWEDSGCQPPLCVPHHTVLTLLQLPGRLPSSGMSSAAGCTKERRPAPRFPRRGSFPKPSLLLQADAELERRRMIHQYENYLQSRHAPDNCYLCRWVHSLWRWGGLEEICPLAAARSCVAGSHQLRALLNAPIHGSSPRHRPRCSCPEQWD